LIVLLSTSNKLSNTNDFNKKSSIPSNFPIKPLLVNGKPNLFVLLFMYGDFECVNIIYLLFAFGIEQFIWNILVKSWKYLNIL
jgi:hypothetical protein